jgi:hypothetical protein
VKARTSLLLLLLAACGGPEDTVATFTSDVVQRESCRVTGEEGREACSRELVETRVRVSLIEDDEQRVWLSGLARQGTPGRSLLGTRDQLGGYLLSDERVQTNTNSGCVLTERLLLSLRVDQEAALDDVGVDPCVALVGRETRTTTTSAACDEVNDPPQQIQRIVRRRWEPAEGCGLDD